MTQEQELVKDLPVEEITESVETEGNNTVFQISLLKP